MPEPYILLDDARLDGAADARLYRAPREVVVALRPDDIGPALDRIDRLSRDGYHMAGMLSYEAGLALESRLIPSLPQRTGAGGALIWFGAFDGYETIPAAKVADWLAQNSHPSPAPTIGPMDPQISFGSYRQAFETLHNAIEAGDIYQANLTFPLAGPWSGDPLALYAAIRPNAAAGYGAVLHDGTHWHLSFSPELFFTLHNDCVTVKPMKGTAPRGRDDTEDHRLRESLAASPKDRAENLMILDLMRNDLSRVAIPGSVRVDHPFAIETYPTVHQMVSTVTANLVPDHNAIDIMRALFPCGSITGAPKIRAMELITQVEQSVRGSYCGSIGYVDPSGDAAFNVAIRTIRLTTDRNGSGAAISGRAILGIGSAIVADSQALPEWRECLIKGAFVRESEVRDPKAAASPASFDLIETMRFTPDEGIVLLEFHLERLAASTRTLGFAFDHHAVRNAIQALCFDAEKPSKLRLVVGRTGAFSLELADLTPALPSPASVTVLRLPVDSGDWRLRHKTSDREFYTQGLRLAHQAGAHDAIMLRDDGLVTEGCISNIFVERDGILLTPAAHLGLLPGVLRRSLIEAGQAKEAELTLDDLADGFFIGNALRGLTPANLLV